MKKIKLCNSSINKGNLILVNHKYPYHEYIYRAFISVHKDYPEVKLNLDTAENFKKIMDELNAWNEIIPVSGLRSRQEQKEIYFQSLAENGQDFTAQFVAKPNHSEHETGLAIDVGLNLPNLDFICPEFSYTGICEDFRNKAISCGFIERYSQGKEDVTGIAHEPWHFRYVGAPHADIMSKYKFSLEEYLEFLKQHVYGTCPYIYKSKDYNYEISFLEVMNGDITELENKSHTFCSISGNNMDGFVITEWYSLV